MLACLRCPTHPLGSSQALDKVYDSYVSTVKSGKSKGKSKTGKKGKGMGMSMGMGMSGPSHKGGKTATGGVYGYVLSGSYVVGGYAAVADTSTYLPSVTTGSMQEPGALASSGGTANGESFAASGNSIWTFTSYTIAFVAVGGGLAMAAVRLSRRNPNIEVILP